MDKLVFQDEKRNILKSFEIFTQKDKISKIDWQLLLGKISSYYNNFTIEVSFDRSVVEFFIYSNKDISSLGTKLDNFILKPIKKQITFTGKKINLQLPTKENILNFKEKEEIKKSRIITNIYVQVRKIIDLYIYLVKIKCNDDAENKYYSRYITFSNPLVNFEFDFKNSVKIKKKSPPLFLKFDEAIKLFNHNNKDSLFEVFGFPYFSKPAFLPIQSFDFDKHALAVGQTGVGKSKFLELFIKNIEKTSSNDEYAIVVIDPHSNLYSDFANLDSRSINLDFINSACDLFPSFSEPKIATELTILLFKTILKDQFNAKMERALKYVLFTMFLTNKMTLINIRRFLTEIEFRKQLLSNVNGGFDYLKQFFDTEYTELQSKFYDIAIMPILVLIDDLQFVPAFSKEPSNSLENILRNNFLTCFSLNRIYLGDKATRLISGLIIQQLFLLMQKGSIKKKIILVIDEVSIVENESLIYILSEARKFNLSLVLSQQYLTQITPDLLKGILSNVYNYFIFKISDEDAKIVAKNIDIAFPDDVLLQQKEKGLSEEDLKRNVLVNLNPRECLVRLFGDGKFYPSFKAKTLNI